MKGKPINPPIQPVRLNPPVKMPSSSQTAALKSVPSGPIQQEIILKKPGTVSPAQRLEFMRENGIAVFVEADRTMGAVHIEKLGNLANWDLFQQLVLYSHVDTLCDRTGSHFPYRLWGQSETGCLISWLSEDRAIALFFDSERKKEALIDWIEKLDQKVRLLYKEEE